MIYPIAPADRAGLLSDVFANTDDTAITSCLEGLYNTFAWADSELSPTASAVRIGGVKSGFGGFAFLAGDASSPSADELALICTDSSLFDGAVIIVPENEEWSAVIERAYGKRAVRESRWATSKTEAHFDPEALKVGAGKLPDGYTLARIDGALYEKCLGTPDFRDAVGNLDGWEDFSRRALGWVCLCDGEPVCTAGSYSAYSGGIEVEIDTLPDHRRKGLARACASALVLECLERGLYPSWDAANTTSLGIARSLGYVFDREYPSYFIGKTEQ